MPMSDLNNYIGKRLLIGLTYVDDRDEVIERVQVHGTIIRMTDEDGLVIRPADGNGEFSLPPDLDALEPAPLGEYRNRSTGEVIINPDYLGRWTIRSPSGDN